jgi:hypothetical protein
VVADDANWSIIKRKENHMRGSATFGASRRWWWAFAALATGLAACGGGGGGDDSPTPPAGDIDLTASNQDPVARSAAVALLGGAVVEAGGLTGADGGMARARSFGARWARERRADILDLSQPCSASGSISATLDDRDNSQSLTPGDVLTADFQDCRELGSDEVVDGRMAVTYTGLGSSPLTVDASAVLSAFRVASAVTSRSTTYDGDFALSYIEPTNSTSTTRVTVGASLAARVVHPQYEDTVTLQPGYRIALYYDLNTPPGAAGGGRTIVEVLGKVASVSAGGIFNVWSQPPGLDSWDVEPYPRSGEVLLQGRNGSIRLQVQSSSAVRIELDADGDAVFESSKDVAWDWLV